MSRRPEPLEKRIGKGNTSGRPLPENPPDRVLDAPTPPVWLTGHALDCWERVGELLVKRGQWTADSEVALAALCNTFAEWVELSEDLRTNGRFQRVRIKSAKPGSRDKGSYMERVRPAVAAFQDADRRLKGWLVEFGLTDASRGKVTMQKPKDEDDVLARYGLQ
jgi:P27 family predicted phage terminase small subunit